MKKKFFFSFRIIMFLAFLLLCLFNYVVGMTLLLIYLLSMLAAITIGRILASRSTRLHEEISGQKTRNIQ